MIKKQLTLKGFDFQELQTQSGLEKLDREFLKALEDFNPHWYHQLLLYRQDSQFAPPEVISQILIDCAVILEQFISELFDIEEAVAISQAATLAHLPIFAFKAYYVLKHARRASAQDLKSFSYLNQIIEDEILSRKLICNDRQLEIAQLGLAYLAEAEQYSSQIATLTQWCVAAMTTEEGRRYVEGWEFFKLPRRLNFENLVEVERQPNGAIERLQGITQRYRDGFDLTDSRMSQRQVMAEVDYCVYCHDNRGDFCSKGFPVKKSDPKQGFKINSLGEILTGCPLEEKISEMHVLKKSGYGISALAMIMVDNPLCPMTGHRICNDCMKACIYQKQEPVNIPQTETGILTDVLALPWGVEIYDLLTRWNPLRPRQWLQKPYNGLKVLVMGMGPAGFSLAHHLLMEGFAVVGMDGLKIEPLPDQYLSQPIYQYADITEKLSRRQTTGFGGVAEYGITVRWDKNFLKLIHLSLLRRQYFQLFGCVRFGGTLKVEDAWLLGFDHLALAIGAGLPEALSIPNSLAPGMRQANDFLMALQLTGAAHPDSLANLQVRLPAVVIGGGLTAVDTATEVQAYYLVQIEKIAARYQILSEKLGEEAVRSGFLPADLMILDEFLTHATELSAERKQAEEENRHPDIIRLARQWGGVTIAYRRSIQDSPAYRRNHEELAKALEEGIYYAEFLEPVAVLLDESGQTQALRCRQTILKEEQTLPARCVLVATGARLNVAYEFEHRGTFLRQNRYEYRRYERIHDHLRHVDATEHVKSPRFGAFTSYAKDHRTVTFLGDTHPVFHGSVVNAIASGQRVYPEICRVLESMGKTGDPREYQAFREKIQLSFSAVAEAVIRHNHRVVELIVRAPIAARQGGAGQFYRVQNFGATQMEALALLGVRHPANPEWLSFYAVEKGPGTRLLQNIQPGDPVALMGPTGAQNRQVLNPENILIIGDIISPAFILSMAEKFVSEGHHVWYLGYFEQAQDLYCREPLEAIAERIIWLTEQDTIEVGRRNDLSFQGIDLLTALQKFPDLSAVDQVWIIGSPCLLNTLKTYQDQGLLLWPKGVAVTSSVYGPMQCMLKGVCAQCLQWQVDPVTGKRSKAVYACSWQHQPFAGVDIANLDQRLGQNRCQETLNNLWFDFSFQ